MSTYIERVCDVALHEHRIPTELIVACENTMRAHPRHSVDYLRARATLDLLTAVLIYGCPSANT